MVNDYKEAINLANTFYNALHKNTFVNIPNYQKEKMELTLDQDLTKAELSQKLFYYSSWKSYFQAMHHRWKFIADHLDRMYKKEYNQKLLEQFSGKKYEREAQIDIELEPISEAILIARSKSDSFKSDLNTAISQYEAISRRVTIEMNGSLS